ncbi:MAG: BMC domain-containing protein [Myxococcota bacterium]
MTENPALALIEVGSLSRAYVVLDAVVKKAPVTVVQYAEVSPGKTILVMVGQVSSVEESLEEARVRSAEALLDHLILPAVHPGVVAALQGKPVVQDVVALGVLETNTAAAAVRASDAGLKAAEVWLIKLRLAAGIGGKGLALFTGPLADVEAALDAAQEAAGAEGFLGRELIPQPHPEIVGRFTG